MLSSDNELIDCKALRTKKEILGTEINIKYYIRPHNTIANLFRIVEAVVATVNQKRQLLVPVTLNEFVIIDKI